MYNADVPHLHLIHKIVVLSVSAFFYGLLAIGLAYLSTTMQGTLVQVHMDHIQVNYHVGFFEHVNNIISVQ